MLEALRWRIEAVKSGLRPRDSLLMALCAFLSIMLAPFNRRLNIIRFSLLSDVTLRTADGLFQIKKGDPLFFSVLTTWEQNLRPLLRCESGVFIDIGAAIGKYSIMIARRLNDRGEVLSIEPDPRNFEKLKRNIDLNHLVNIRAVQAAAYNMNGRHRLNLSPISPLEHTLLAEFLMPTPRPTIDSRTFVYVDVRRLDDLVREQAINPCLIRLIKIDVEGVEVEVLEGLERVLSEGGGCRARILVECTVLGLEGVKRVLARFGYDACMVPGMHSYIVAEKHHDHRWEAQTILE